MIISKTPLRLTLGGGGTDLPPYYSMHGGFVVTAALDKYIYLIVNRRFEEEVRLSYSITEIVKSIDDIRHPVVREGLRLLGLTSYLEDGHPERTERRARSLRSGFRRLHMPRYSQ